MKRFGLAVVLATAAFTAPAGGIVGGEPDAGRHPNVAVLDVGLSNGTSLQCTGTLIAPDVVLTAAHCVSVAGAATVSIHVSFDEEPTYDDNFVLQAPFLEAVAYAAHHGFDPSNLTPASLQFDMAAVILAQPATDLWPGLVPASLPSQSDLDGLYRGPRARFEIVGYGIREAAGNGQPAVDLDTVTRRTGLAQLRLLTPEFVIAHATNPRSNRNAIICSGDSGGPLFAGPVVVGVTSFHQNLGSGARNPNAPHSGCEGVSSFVRLDTATAQAFLANFVDI